MTYHISSGGKPVLCEATVKACPLGGEHFETETQAYEHLAATHETVPTPVKGADVIDRFRGGETFNIADLLNTIDPKEEEAKRSKRREDFEAKKEERRQEALDPIATKLLLIEKTKELNDERVTLTSHTDRIARAKLVSDLMETIRRADPKEMDKALKGLGADDEVDIKPVSNGETPKGKSPEVEKKIAEIEKEVSEAKKDQKEVEFITHPRYGRISKADYNLIRGSLGDLEPGDGGASKPFGPEPDSLGKVFGDAVKMAGEKFKETSTGKSARDAKVALIAKLIREV